MCVCVCVCVSSSSVGFFFVGFLVLLVDLLLNSTSKR